MSKLDAEQLKKYGKVDIIHTPESMEELQRAYGNLSANEAAVGTQFAHMGWNACLHMLNEAGLIKDHRKVKFAWDDSGNCREYYRIIDNDLLICRQEETPENWVWYTVTDDGCYYEPISAIHQTIFIIEDEDENK